jgi:hypothetical protein
MAAAKPRLAALLADPATQLPHLAAELAALAGARGDAAAEAALGRGLRRLLARGSPGFKVRAVMRIILTRASTGTARCGGLECRLLVTRPGTTWRSHVACRHRPVLRARAVSVPR